MYIAELTGLAPDELPLRRYNVSSLVWKGTTEPVDEVARIRARLTHGYSRLLELLVARDLLAAQAAAGLTTAIEVGIQDRRSRR